MGLPELESQKAEIERLILDTNSFQYSPTKPFQLSSGILTPYYFDLRRLNGHPEGLNTIAEMFYDILKKIPVSSVGGLESGSISIASAISQLSYIQHKKDPLNPLISAFYVRKKIKEHGSKNRIEGMIESPVAIIDDVITSGNSAIKAIEAVQEKNYECACLLSIIFRGTPSDKERIEKIIKYRYIFTESELVAKLLDNKAAH